VPEPGVRELYLREDVKDAFADDPLRRAFELRGETVRAVARRETLRVECHGRVYYLKRHRGVGWPELIKNWLVLKRPVIGARNEYEACRHLESKGLAAPTVAAFAESRGSPASRSSFVLCDALTDREDLQSVTRRWAQSPPEPLEVRRLVEQIAAFAARLHGVGVVHRDFYLCHILVRCGTAGVAGVEPEPLAVLDLHRALIFDTVPSRWRERDLAALLFSTLDLPLSRRSWLRFIRRYSGKPLKRAFAEDGRFWSRVYRRALSLYDKGVRKGITPGTFQP
jgi:heptose I phosphotransferase